MKARTLIIVPGVAAALIVACASPALIQAQSASTTRRPDPVQREQQRHVQSLMMEAALERTPAREGKRKDQLVMAQIREDFLRIQVIDRKLGKAVSAQPAPNFGFIAKSLSELGKRAVRLRTNLSLATSEEMPARLEVEPPTALAQLRSSLSLLSDTIYEFVSNPMFVTAKVLDARLSAKAKQDLDQIIEISSELKRSSERLKAESRSK